MTPPPKSKKNKVKRSPHKSFNQKVSAGVLDLIEPIPQNEVQKEKSIKNRPKAVSETHKIEEIQDIRTTTNRVPYPIRCREDIIDAFEYLYTKQKLTNRKLKKAEFLEEALSDLLKKYNDKDALALLLVEK